MEFGGFLVEWAMRKIILFPNPVLRKRAVEVKKVSNKLVKEVKSLKTILLASEDGAGLAASQVGINRRFFGIKEEGKVRIYINPKMKASFGKKEYAMLEKEDGSREGFLEGCLSFPGIYGRVKRWLKIEASWQIIFGKKLMSKKVVLTDFEAIVFQHEKDHLDGILFVDHVKEEAGKMFGQKEGEKVKMKPSWLLAKEKK